MFKTCSLTLLFLLGPSASGAASRSLLRRHQSAVGDDSSIHTTPRSLHSYLEGIYFEKFSTGDVVTNLGNNITVQAWKRTSIKKDKYVQASAMIFNSSNPTGNDADLGTPNESFGGPGIGKGGTEGSLFANKHQHANVLIVSEDEDATDPDDNHKGGIISFTFGNPVTLETVGFLDNGEGVKFYIETSDGDSTSWYNGNGGDNSYEDVQIGKPSVVFLEITFHGSGAIANLAFSPTVSPFCSRESLVSFDSLEVGSSVSDLGSGMTVSAQKRNRKVGPLVAGEAMIFDSQNPTGGDFDLGTPHNSVGGPGMGNAGKPKRLFPNIEPQGRVLIISEDNDGSDPDDNKFGGVLTFVFGTPIDLDSMGLLDNNQGAMFEIFTSDGGISSIENYNGGHNSFELVKIGKPQVTKIVVTFYGSAAITQINKLVCMSF